MFTKKNLSNTFGLFELGEELKQLKGPQKTIGSKALYFFEKYSANWNSLREHLVIQFFKNSLYAVHHFVLLSTMIWQKG